MNFLLQSSADHSAFGVPSKKKTNDSAFMVELAFNVKDAMSVQIAPSAASPMAEENKDAKKFRSSSCEQATTV